MSWEEKCKARGGTPIRYGPNGGPVCRLPAGTGVRYEPADLSLTERLSMLGSSIKEGYETKQGQAVVIRDAVLYGGKEPPGTLLGGTGAIIGTQVGRVFDGAGELAANALGIPKGAAKTIVVVAALGVAAYIALPYVKLATRK